MATITRTLPDSNPTRLRALKRAKVKRDNSPIATDVLRAATVTKLDLAEPMYKAAMLAVDQAQNDASAATLEKEVSRADLHLFCSHYLIVFNLAIRRGEIPAAARALYRLDVSSDALPYMDSEDALQEVAENIAAGEAARVLAGGAAMTNPTAAQVAIKQNRYENALVEASEKADLLDTKQEIVEGHNHQVDELILRIWDEVESFFNNETNESKRENAREWGVVYNSRGAATDVRLTILQADGSPAAELEVSIEEGKGSRTTHNDGTVEFTTTLHGDLTIEVITNPIDSVKYTETIQVQEGVTFVGVIHLP